MKFEIISFDEEKKWDMIVKQKADIYYQREYIEPFFKQGDGEPCLAYAQEENNIVFNVFFKRDIAELDYFKEKIKRKEYFDIITPYGYGGIDIINKPTKELEKYFFGKFNDYCIQNNIISEFIRLSPLNNNNIYYENENYEILPISKTVYMNIQNDEQIWSEMESRCRNTIRKAQKSELKIEIGYNKKMMDEFQEIYTETMKRDNAEEYYFFDRSFFDIYYKNMEQNSIIVTAYKEEKAISSSLFIYSNENAHYHLSGTLTEYLRLGANSLIIYEAAKKLSSLRCKRLHLGGGYGGDDSPLLKFKKSFSKNELLDFYIGKKVYNKEKYRELVKIREKEENFDSNSKFFPLYRR